MDAIEYIRRFRKAYDARDVNVALDVADQLRGESWGTVSLTCARLMGLGDGESSEETRWHVLNLRDVLLESFQRRQ